MHITDKLYQTLPLYSNLQTTGVYVYAADIRTKSREAIINAEASGLVSDEVSLTSIPVKVENGLSKFFPSEKLASLIAARRH